MMWFLSSCLYTHTHKNTMKDLILFFFFFFFFVFFFLWKTKKKTNNDFDASVYRKTDAKTLNKINAHNCASIHLKPVTFFVVVTTNTPPPRCSSLLLLIAPCFCTRAFVFAFFCNYFYSGTDLTAPTSSSSSSL